MHSAADIPRTLLWLTAVASGVLARGGRAHWVARALLLVALAMPIVRHQTVTPRYACLYLAAVALLLTCGRVTQELRKLLDQARYDADHDGLTGALSRTAFRDQLDRVAAQPDAAALLLVDLDNFGQVNKTAGHAAGDALLRLVVERMQAASPDVVVGRLGGDEFAAIVRTEDPRAHAEALLGSLNEEDPTDGRPAIHATLGMALIPPGHVDGARSRPAPRTPSRRWRAFRRAAPPARCTGSRWPTSSACPTAWS